MHKALLSRGYTFSRSWMVENSNGGMSKILSNFGHFGKFLPKLEISNWNNVYHGFSGWGLIFTKPRHLKTKVKKAYFGGFLAKNEKNKYVFGKQMKSLFYESVLIFFLGGLE